MTKREEFIERLMRADTDTFMQAYRLLFLFVNSDGFKVAFDEATPAGEELPPVDVMKALVKEWTKKEGLG